jgi:hypothetical protein
MRRFETLRWLECNARTYASTFEEVFESGQWRARARPTPAASSSTAWPVPERFPRPHSSGSTRGPVELARLGAADASIGPYDTSEIRVCAGAVALLPRLRFITSDHVQVLDLTTPAKFELVQESFGLLPTPGKFHLTFPDTRGGTNLCIRLDPHEAQETIVQSGPGSESLNVKRRLTRDYQKVQCLAARDSDSLEGVGRVIRSPADRVEPS